MQNDERKKLKKGMGLFDLVLFNIVAIVGLRWTAVAAGVGPSSIFLWLAAMILFFIPSALVVVELSSRYPDEGGIYVWTREAFGEFEGYMCGFCYWVNNLIYYPNLLIFLSGIFLYVGGAKYLGLEKNPLYAVIFSLVVLWFAIGMNMIGLKMGKWVQNLGGLGTWIPAILLVAAGGFALYKFGPANTFTGNLVPDFKSTEILGVFSTLCFGFAGLELMSCLGGEIKKPGKNIPRAIVISGVVIALIYILSTSALLVILPSKEINIISGAIQVIAKVGEKLHILWIAPIVAFLMTIGGVGGCGAWLSGTARIPFVMGLDKYLPEWVTRVHPKWGTPANAILTQGIFSTVFVLMTLGTTVKASYEMLISATALLYFIPYIYMFLAFISIKMKMKKQQERGGTSHCERSEAISLDNGGNFIDADKSGNRGGTHQSPTDQEKSGPKFNFPAWIGVVGLITTAIAMFLALAPSSAIKNVARYELQVVGGTIGFVLLGMILFWVAKWRQKRGI